MTSLFAIESSLFMLAVEYDELVFVGKAEDGLNPAV